MNLRDRDFNQYIIIVISYNIQVYYRCSSTKQHYLKQKRSAF